MKRVIGFAALLVVLTALGVAAFGQDSHQNARVYLGVSNLNIANQNIQGWDGSAQVRVFDYDGIRLEGVGTVSGHYEAGGRIHQFLGGPQVSFDTLHGRVTPFVRGLFGTSYTGGVNSFTKSVGFGGDVNFGKRYFARPVQLDFRWINDVPLRITQYSAGVGVRF